jgi:hypothetical protein
LAGNSFVVRSSKKIIFESSFAIIPRKELSSLNSVYSGEQAHLATRQELTTWRTESEAAIDLINTHILQIRADLEANQKDHEAFNHDLNTNRLHLTRFEEATQLELKAATESHNGLRDAHERLTREVEEQDARNRDAQARAGKELRALGGQADEIRGSLELLETEVRKNESSRKNNDASINNKLEELATKQEEHRDWSWERKVFVKFREPTKQNFAHNFDGWH